MGPLCVQGWVLKNHEISLFYRGKVIVFKGLEGARTLCLLITYSNILKRL